jgi:hypothetical protein
VAGYTFSSPLIGNFARIMRVGQSAESLRATWAGCHVDRPAGVFTPRLSSTWAMPTSVTTPDRRMSAITVRVVLSCWRRWADQAARAAAAVSAAIGPATPPWSAADPAGLIFGNGCQNVQRGPPPPCWRTKLSTAACWASWPKPLGGSMQALRPRHRYSAAGQTGAGNSAMTGGRRAVARADRCCRWPSIPS